MSSEVLTSSPAFVLGTAAAAVGGAVILGLTIHRQTNKLPDGLKPISDLPAAPKHLITGNLRELMRRDVHRVLTQWGEQFGPMYTINLLGQTVLVVTDINLARPLLKGPGELRKWATAYKGARQMNSASKVDTLFTLTEAEGLPWYAALRKAIAPAFAPRNLSQRFPRTRGHALRLAEKLASLSGPQEADISAYVMASSLDNIADIGFDLTFNAIDDPSDNSFLKGVKVALDEVTLRLTDPLRETRQKLLWFLPSSRQVLQDHENTYKVYQDVIQQITSRGPPSEDDQSIAACLLRFRDPVTGKPLEGDDLQAQLSTLFLAGMDTAATVVLWALYNVARSPAVGQFIEEELTEAGLITSDGRPGRLPEWSDLTLPYLNMVMKETMRLQNVAGSTSAFRVTDKPTQVGDTWVPAGTPVWLPLGVMSNVPINFPRPHEFIPERWAESRNTMGPVGGGDVEPTINPAAGGGPGGITSSHDWMALAFSQGSRGCMGMNQGLVQVRVTLLVLLSRVRFQLGPTLSDAQKVEEAEEMALTMHCGLGYPFIITPR